jgi:hypothetical protein
MDPLKIFATLETSLSEVALQEYLCERGWSVDANTQNLLYAEFSLQLEYSGEGLFVIRGEIPRSSDLDDLLVPLTRSLYHEKSHIHLDVFEEDGRLVKRLQI